MTPAIDNDQTVVGHRAGVPRYAGWVGATDNLIPAKAASDHLALPVGTRLAEFEITGLVGVGGFGIVYLVHDHSLGRQVAVKEYMPSSLALRTDGITVKVRSRQHLQTFLAGLKSFINEARMLALFDHPALVKVYRFWEANGTAYMVMPYYEGQTLKKALADMPKPPSESWLKSLLAPLLDALQLIHDKRCFHRDIAPDNIFLLPGGQPVLLDFGAARQVIGDMDRNLTVFLKPGYAPIEQYASDPDMPQGAWTDIYALGAVMHHALMGKPPVIAISRLVTDNLVPLQKSCAGRYSESFLAALDQALAVRQQQRPQNIAELRVRLCLLPTAVASGPVSTLAVPSLTQTGPPPPPATDNDPTIWIWGGAVAGLAAFTIAFGLFIWLDDSLSPQTVAVAPPVRKPVRKPTADQASEPTEPITAESAKITGNTAVKALLDKIPALRDTTHLVDVSVVKPRLMIGRDNFQFGIRSAKGGYVYVLMLGSGGDLTLLFPNALDRDNLIQAGQELVLPSAKWNMLAAGPPGTNHLVAMVAEQPRDFSKAGLRSTGSFGEFSIQSLQQPSSANPAVAVLSGVAKCPAQTGACSAAYGALQFSIEEAATP